MGKSVNNKFVFAGGPGAGKTTVLDALRVSGLHCVPDVARALIQARLAEGLSPRPEAVEFASSIFDKDVENYLAAPADAICFYDRGVVDALGMLFACNAMSSDEIDVNLRQFPYNEIVFLFPPWEEIYQTDAERDQTFTESVQVFESVTDWYSSCGYRTQLVPRGSVDERAAHVQSVVAKAIGPDEAELRE